MKILVVLILYDMFGDIGKKIGFWFEELVVLYYMFKDVGVELMLVLLKGG